MRNACGCPVTASFVSLNNDQKQWLFAVFNVSRFLCANGLAFRGSDESDIDTGDGLFLRAFSQLLFPLEEKWGKIHKNLPKNAKYTSHDIQNEVIEVLASLVKTKIAEDVRKAELFTIIADGTTDKNRKEIQGIVCRYLSSDGNVKERCINVKGIDDRSAKGIFKFIKEALVQFNISVDGLVSQSFDGASVMSGDYGGLQRLISDFCDRNVLYVHCFLHKIHLVVSFPMQNLDEVKEYFDTTAALYKFFKKSAVLESYNGTALKRLIETRWSGHFESTSHVHKNYGDLIQALMVASKNKKLSGEDRAQATGLLSLMEDNEDHVFVFITCMLMDVLKPIDIVVKQLQSPDENLISALHVVNAVKDDIKSKRENNTSNEKVKKMVDDFLESVRITSTDGVQVQRRPTRNTAVPSRFDDFLITDRIPSANNSRTNCQIFVECLDLLDAEFLRRFSEENIALWEAMLALSPSSDNYLDYDALIPLFEYAVNIPVIRDFYQKEKLSREDLEAECRIFSRVFKDKEWPKNAADKVDLSEVANIVIKEHQKGAPVLSSLYKVAITAGFTSMRVECVFSSLTRVDSPQRRSMKTEREANLAYLSFESEVLINDITFDDFYKAWNLKPRALSL
ncbi:zinc finger MYM-type 1 [Paramuricea clavata]|uniref:Zinc finger MYM-type 1 n=1 Tax=Paramuricea clavata TaxID=317549 RepID=A0A6S7IG41_PARCT|nr:zinc finger MYM-type 1 [Paramuricea clavata]